MVKIAIITEKVSNPKLLISLMIIIPIALWSKYHENDKSPIFDNKSNLNLYLVINMIEVKNIKNKKYNSFPEYLSFKNTLNSTKIGIRNNKWKFFSLK